MKIIKGSFERRIDVSAAVTMWNYWDHEHLTVVHGNYTEAKILHETRHFVVFLLTYRLPIFSFLKSQGLHFSTVINTGTVRGERTYNIGLFGIPSVTTIRIFEEGKDNCRVTMDYEFTLRGWRVLLAPLLYPMMARWNQQVWDEDLPLKYRRQKALRHGFKDFVGMPDRVSERVNDKPLDVQIPVPRPKGNPLDAMGDFDGLAMAAGINARAKADEAGPV